MNERAEELKARSAAFAKAVIELCDKVPGTQAGRTMSQQLIDAATSVAANYRATCRARTPDEFVSKIGLVAEEADECYGWVCLLVETKLLKAEDADTIRKESYELTAIFTASFRTARRRQAARKAAAARRGNRSLRDKSTMSE